MKDSRGIDLGHKDIIARRTELGWRISRVSLIGYTDATKQQPLVACVDFSSHSASSSWQYIADSTELQLIACASDLKESPEELIKRLPKLGNVLDDFEVHMLNAQFSGS